MAKNNKMPAIRFSGYTDTWEQRKLSDISTKVTTKNVDVHYTETLTNSAEQGIISQVDFFDKEISNKDNINGYYIVDNNDFIYNPRISTLAPVGPINRNKLNRTGIMSPLYTVFRSSNVDLGFLEWYFQSSHWHRYMKLNGDSGARADRIAIKDSTFFEMPIKIPVNIKEQVLIGEILEKFNQYITLHQRKLEKLKLTKKALLQKLFPQNGSKFPELRFKGFTAAWEQCKLSDITEIVMGQSPSSKNYTDNPNDNILVQGNADLKDGKVVPRLWTKEITKTIDKDGIVLTVRAPVGDVAKTDYKVVLGRGVAGIKGNDYIYQFLQKLQNNRYWVSLSSGSTFESINSNDIKDLIIDIPSIEEQTKISMLLNNVNSIITLHQRKLEMLKNVKKGLLQKMFV